MIAVIQRVSSSSVEIEKKISGQIGKGLLVLVGIEDADNDEDIEWLAGKIVNLRIFNDAEGVMNVSVKDEGGDILVVSQFTLHASTRKGNRPSYLKASSQTLLSLSMKNSRMQLRVSWGNPFNPEFSVLI